jgi:cytochrome c-type biogenesis protein CcmE
MHGQEFDIKNRDGILLKCPSKYKDDPAMAKKGLDQN